MLKLTLATGETIVGTPNYVTTEIAEIRLASMTDKVTAYRTIRRSEIARIERVAK